MRSLQRVLVVAAKLAITIYPLLATTLAVAIVTALFPRHSLALFVAEYGSHCLHPSASDKHRHLYSYSVLCFAYLPPHHSLALVHSLCSIRSSRRKSKSLDPNIAQSLIDRKLTSGNYKNPNHPTVPCPQDTIYSNGCIPRKRPDNSGSTNPYHAKMNRGC
ncbi:uncharacterized protein G2W53_016312 [Senna tora]|uniref:Uncharacterized protein n=1 Tax=Senna tora TaxID=362788 RepID=A0A834TMI8_9FABA|nr:uncharacterized protein G2W53_016312 [Senna tora]